MRHTRDSDCRRCLGWPSVARRAKTTTKDKSGKPEKETKDQEKEDLWLKAAESETPPKEIQGLRCTSRAAPALFNLRLYPPRSPLLLPPRRESRCQQGRVSAERTHGLQAAGRGAVELPV